MFRMLRTILLFFLNVSAHTDSLTYLVVLLAFRQFVREFFGFKFLSLIFSKIITNLLGLYFGTNIFALITIIVRHLILCNLCFVRFWIYEITK